MLYIVIYNHILYPIFSDLKAVLRGQTLSVKSRKTLFLSQFHWRCPLSFCTIPAFWPVRHSDAPGLRLEVEHFTTRSGWRGDTQLEGGVPRRGGLGHYVWMN